MNWVDSVLQTISKVIDGFTNAIPIILIVLWIITVTQFLSIIRGNKNRPKFGSFVILFGITIFVTYLAMRMGFPFSSTRVAAVG